MKKILIAILLLCAAAQPAEAQKLITGVKAPDLKISEYLTAEPVGGEPLLIEFFYSPSQPCLNYLPVLNELAKANAGRISVLLLAREERDKIASLMEDKGYAFAVALDDQGKTFTSYGVQFVPFGVLLDAKGRVLWFGNSTQLNQQTIDSALGE